jgi:S-formylglutathione hydrolase FrmB
MPMDHWEGQQWNTSPGNLCSVPEKMKIDPAAGGTIRLALTERIPPVTPPEDTRYVKHVKIRSELVSRFWGQDVYIGAVVLLPEGFDSHPEARYPVAYLQSHFMPTMRGFVERPENLFFKERTSAGFPRFLLVIPQDPNPFYDDSYAVNSANVGPYGDALMQELIPYVEQKFRAIGQPWARTVFGGSTGGWRTLALQVFHPDEFNGAWAFCPDPVDFRYFQLVNIYQDENAYYANSAWKKEPSRPWMRNIDDQVLATQEQASIFELVLGTKGRSGQQMDIFQAVFGPVGSDGYPRLLYDKKTGFIDKEVAAYWRENYDLSHIIERDWATLGPKLNGKLHIYIGDTDTFYLEEATMQLEKFFKRATNPVFEGTIEYGKRAPHCWSGCQSGRNPTLCHLPAMAEHIRKTAPPGADLDSWRY